MAFSHLAVGVRSAGWLIMITLLSVLCSRFWNGPGFSALATAWKVEDVSPVEPLEHLIIIISLEFVCSIGRVIFISPNRIYKEHPPIRAGCIGVAEMTRTKKGQVLELLEISGNF